ncbi:MAG: putative anti-sigma regulatory factor, serine/threonine protein kinase [Acidimicrobiales bacterium]|jgi:serine/threonine-protein kinase RsbW|nr:putative anti-sigma regulatory factor, serine/threonine protein kinase [Acidimicrobiales bacterium]
MARARETPVQINLNLSLPRDESTVTVARHVVRVSLCEIGVTEDCVADIEVALSEASTNVLRHSGPGDAYEVSCEMNDASCIIRVIDAGRGFDHASLGFGEADGTAEQGRGIQLMRSLVDSVRFESIPEDGTIVHLEKGLEFTERSLVARSRR